MKRNLIQIMGFIILVMMNVNSYAQERHMFFNGLDSIEIPRVHCSFGGGGFSAITLHYKDEEPVYLGRVKDGGKAHIFDDVCYRRFGYVVETILSLYLHPDYEITCGQKEDNKAFGILVKKDGKLIHVIPSYFPKKKAKYCTRFIEEVVRIRDEVYWEQQNKKAQKGEK